MERADDAGVYQLTSDIALIQTVDFFTPVVDDPFLFGQIAVANALSDVYAMGGRPLCAMNLVAFPIQKMDVKILKEILRGGLEKMDEAEVTLAGGHSIDDNEIKYGLAVTGIIHPQKILTKGGARPGDQLILTKPLGTGIVNTAIKCEQASPAIIDRVVTSMVTLNRRAMELMLEAEIHACTDVTGFGLLGHSCEMIEASDVGFILHAPQIPIFPEAQEYAEAHLKPGGLRRNRIYREPMIDVQAQIPSALLDIFYDPQTSGGLLLALPAEQAAPLIKKLHAQGVPHAAVIGEVVAEPKQRIIIAD